ncbi:hypothetical protein RF11_12042 [Thelohanellus kitauei]|uniref:Uncharacterized protein n=1 Tax=Thelohanellus kitauei TaxID=669202 RepID=A0A0C2N4E0_THEKT|nr:hypothetical protein RF11_12042 [Thelohanellus kitauei]
MKNQQFNMSLTCYEIVVDLIQNPAILSVFEKIFIDGSELIIEHQKTAFQSHSIIKCRLEDSGSEIKIHGCQISVQTSNTYPFYTHEINYQFKLNKYTKYEFSEHTTQFTFDDDEEKTLSFSITHLNITFRGYTKRCELIYSLPETILIEIDSTGEIFPCEGYKGTYVNEGSMQAEQKFHDINHDINFANSYFGMPHYPCTPPSFLENKTGPKIHKHDFVP